MNTANREQEFFELVCYMATSARNLIRETRLYGPFRLVDSISRLIDILSKEGVSSNRLLKIQEKIEAGKYTVMEGEDIFTAFLEDLVLTLVPMMEKAQDQRYSPEERRR